MISTLNKKLNTKENDLHTIFQKYNAITFFYNDNLYYEFKNKRDADNFIQDPIIESRIILEKLMK